MYLAEFEAKKASLRKELSELEDTKICCMTCTLFAKPRCTKFDANPPPAFVNEKADCPEWDWDEVPF